MFKAGQGNPPASPPEADVTEYVRANGLLIKRSPSEVKAGMLAATTEVHAAQAAAQLGFYAPPAQSFASNGAHHEGEAESDMVIAAVVAAASASRSGSGDSRQGNVRRGNRTSPPPESRASTPSPNLILTPGTRRGGVNVDETGV